MKNNMFRGAALIAAAMFAGSVFAQGNIATVRSNDLVRKSPQFQAMEAKMKADFERRAADLQAEAKKLEDDVKKFQAEADLLSPQDRQRREKDLNTRRIDFGYKQQEFRADVGNRERELTVQMMTQIKSVIEEVAKEKGATIVLQDPVYSAPGMDITDDILSRLAR